MEIVMILGVGVFVVGIIYIIREIVCWYWKLNDVVSLLGKIEIRLAHIQQSLDPSSTTPIQTNQAQAMTSKADVEFSMSD